LSGFSKSWNNIMLHKWNKCLYWILIVLMVICIYLFLLFPNIEKDFRSEPITIDTQRWNSSDTLSYYFIEYTKIHTLDWLLSHTKDSIFVVNYLNRQQNSVTLKNPKEYLIHFTNNFTTLTMFCFSDYLKTGDSAYLELFLKNVRWMTDNITIISDTVGIWQNNDIIYDKYTLDFGWASSYSQGIGLSVICRAYQLTKQEKYLQIAEKVLNSFNLDYKNGGILDIDRNGNHWYLEYPANPPAYVLNGMIYGVFGIYDYWRLTGSPKANRYFQRGIQTLENNLPRYDKGYWSAYDLLFNQYCAGYNYHKNVHISQLDVLYQISNNSIFDKYQRKFDRYLNEPYLSIFKLKFTLDAVSRRLTYKNPLKKYKKQRFR